MIIDYGTVKGSVYLRAADETEAVEWLKALSDHVNFATKRYIKLRENCSDASSYPRFYRYGSNPSVVSGNSSVNSGITDKSGSSGLSRKTDGSASTGSGITDGSSSSNSSHLQVNLMSAFTMTSAFASSSSITGAIPTQRGRQLLPTELLTAIMAFLLEEGYEYTGDLNTSITTTIRIPGGRDLYLTIHYLPPEKSHSSRAKQTLGVLVASSTIFTRAPMTIREELTNLLTRANYGLRMGCFIMDYTRDGMIKYRSELPVENFRLEEMVHLVRKLLSLNLQTHRRYVPAFAALLEEGKPAADAIKLVEGDVTVRKSRFVALSSIRYCLPITRYYYYIRSEAEQQAIIGLVERILKDRDFPYETLPQAIVAYYAVDVETTLVINIRIEENMALVISHAINSSPLFARQQLGEVAIRASARCRIGQFNFDYRDGQVLFQTELPLFGISDEDLEHFLIPLIMENVMTQRLYLPSFQAVIQRGLTPADAIALVDNSVNASAGQRQSLGSATAAAGAGDTAIGAQPAISSPSPHTPPPAVRQQGSPQGPSRVTELDITKLRNCSKKIGRGGMGEVYLCEYDGVEVAVKQVFDHEEFPREIEIQASVDHLSLVRLRGQIHGSIESINGVFVINAHEQKLLMVSEYCAGGNLRQWLESIRSDPKRFHELDVICFMEDIAKGMAELHRREIIHRDLKPENIFLDDDCRRAKIGDFGLARQLRRRQSTIPAGDAKDAKDGGNQTLYTVFDDCGTHYYIAPECFDHGDVSRASDVYAFAIILHNVFITQDSNLTYNEHEILGGNLPSTFNLIFTERLKTGMRPSIDIKSKLPFSQETLTVILPLMQRCWDGDQNKRPKFDEVATMLKQLRERLRERRSLPSAPSSSHHRATAPLPVLIVTDFAGEVRKLGQGAMGAAYAATYHGTQVALKEVLKDKDNERFLTEINTQAFVKHPNIVQVMGTTAARVRPGTQKDVYTLVPDNERQMMVSEYCTEGSLGSYLKAVREQRRAFDETRLVAFMRDIAKGMAWLHGLKIVHKDLKPENIFLHDSLRQAKIGDFGLAKTLRKRDLNEGGSTLGARGSTYTIFGNAGTLYYIAPECFVTGRTTRSADVYAFGVILHNCFITQDEARTYNARQVLGNGTPSEYSKVFIDRLIHDHLRPHFPSSTKMSPEVAEVILPMIRECIADEDSKAVNPDDKAVGDQQSSRRPKFQDLLSRLENLFDRLKVKKPLTTSEELPVVSPASPPITIPVIPPAPPAAVPSSPTKLVVASVGNVNDSTVALPDVKAPAPPVEIPSSLAGLVRSMPKAGPLGLGKPPAVVASPAAPEKKVEGVSSAVDSRSPSTSIRSTSTATRLQPVTALNKIKEELSIDPSISVQEAIDMAAEDLGLTEELTGIRTLRGKVLKICEGIGLNEEGWFDPNLSIGEKEFKVDSVVKSTMKYDLGIADGMPVIPTLTSFADALGINDAEFTKLPLKVKAERVAEELGIYSGRVGTMATASNKLSTL